MPRPKGVGRKRIQNFTARQHTPLNDSHQSDLEATVNDPTEELEPRLAHNSEGEHIGLPSIPEPVPESNDTPDDLAGSLRGLVLDVLPEDITLEEPQPGTDDSHNAVHCRSLADPEGDEARNLPAPEPEDENQMQESVKRANNQPIPKAEAKQMVSALNSIIQSSFHGVGKKRVSTLGETALTRLRLMAGTLNLVVETNMKLMDASMTAAIAYGRGEWAARLARHWIREFQEKNEVPSHVYGTWNPSVIEDEDLSAVLREWLRGHGKYVQARNVIDFFDAPEAHVFLHLLDGPPTIRTAQRWMHNMGYVWMKERRGQFADGHERDDVVEYRMKVYIPEWIRLEKRMRSWEDDGTEIPPTLARGEQVVVIWFHDESTFYAHDRRLTRWVHESETPGIHKKGEGVSLMVADFVSADYGWLRLGSEVSSTSAADGNVPDDENLQSAQVVFRAGKNRDGWFGNADVVKQLARAIAIVKRQYPNEDHIFIFDNATIHTKAPDNAPNVSRMTLGPSQKVHGEEVDSSGEKVKVNYAPAILPNGTVQDLYHPIDHVVPKLQGAFKGIAHILEERGVQGIRKLRLDCPKGCLPHATNCCARRIMMNQPDILSQKSILQLQAAAEGCSVIYLPKYHCELNPIEQCWGAAKRVYRDSPTSSSEADLRHNMLSSLESVKLQSIRRFAARSQRFVHAYRQGLSGSEAAWATKRYRGHRTIPEALLAAMDRNTPAT